ncbi:hypothetical protein HMPREF0812_00787 [Streptococcus agalactiae]|nr:hypothetical protein HMPREF1882_01926 [Streptococcus agalactiae]KXA57063.1 hypothetical protein HMPREF0812_00787 [Streptococcus agalactiae]
MIESIWKGDICSQRLIEGSSFWGIFSDDLLLLNLNDVELDYL